MGRAGDFVHSHGVRTVGHERELGQEVAIACPCSIRELGSVSGILVLDHRAQLDLSALGGLPADANG